MCNGLGIIQEITEDAVLPDRSLNAIQGAVAPLVSIGMFICFNS
jgi:excinuclease ABC subunit A